jgi:MacB-like periplasmic core domain
MAGGFTAEEDRSGANHVLLLSYGLWRRRFGADADIIGKSVSLNGSPYVVIGIFGPGFNSEITFLSQLGVALVAGDQLRQRASSMHHV